MKGVYWVIYVRRGLRKDGKWWPLDFIGFSSTRLYVIDRYNNWALNKMGWPLYRDGSRRGVVRAVTVRIETVEELPE